LTGNGLLILVSAEVDTSGKTYYGEQSLHFMTTKGEGSLVPCSKSTYDVISQSVSAPSPPKINPLHGRQ